MWVREGRALRAKGGCHSRRGDRKCSVIASIAFRNFKALRNAQIRLERFNLVIGPNGSGKSSLMESLVRLRTLARLPLADAPLEHDRQLTGPEVAFRFQPPFDGWEALMLCASEDRCDLLQAVPLPAGAGIDDWAGLRARLLRIRRYEFDHMAMGRPSTVKDGTELTPNGSNLAAVLARRRSADPAAYEAWKGDVLRALPEYADVSAEVQADGQAILRLRLDGTDEKIGADDLSQGSLYALALFALAYDPEPPSVLCVEELDRGLHPRLLRDARDALYRLSHPETVGLSREPVQVIATTHSPYLLDLFRDHPEEVVISQKDGRAAHFTRLSDRTDLKELMEGASLGDLWYSGVLGGVPGESNAAPSFESQH